LRLILVIILLSSISACSSTKEELANCNIPDSNNSSIEPSELVGVWYYQLTNGTTKDWKTCHFKGQGDRMSVHYLVGAHNPAINTFSRNSGFIKQRFRLPTMLTFVGSFYNMCKITVKCSGTQHIAGSVFNTTMTGFYIDMVIT
jgi:hypothetical protein